MITKFLVCSCVLYLYSGLSVAVSGEPADSSSVTVVDELIRKAGDADDDKVRLALLQELRELPELDPRLRGELDNLIGHIDQWINCDRLMYFYDRVWQDGDWDFGVPQESVLYPLTWLYRGRMLTWTAFEYGGIRYHPARCRQVFEEAQRNFRLTKKHFPDNRVARMYLGEPIPPHKRYLPVPGAPAWAVYQREGLERMTDIVEWWIDNRQQESGEFGGRWGDDCEMWGSWSPVMIAFESARVSAAQERLSTGLMSQPHMRTGYTDHLSDVEHSAEPSAEAIIPMMYLKPDDPQWGQKSLRLAELMKTLWTGRNERGFLQFRSTFISGTTVDSSPERACDTAMHPRVVMPTLLYWQRTGDPELTKLFTDWMDTWVEATAGTNRGKPAGVLPSALHWPDGNIGGVGENWWNPENYAYGKFYSWPGSVGTLSTILVLTWQMTGDDKYLEPIRSMVRLREEYLASPPEEEPEPGSKDWCAAQLGGISGTLAKYHFATGNTEFDSLLNREASPYVHFRLTGDREAMIRALRDNAEALRGNFESHTSEPRYTDKIMKFNRLMMRPNMMFRRPLQTIHYPTPGLLYQMATGEPGTLAYFPLNAVRWLTHSRNIAALVTEANDQKFSAELFTFGDLPREMGAEFYLLKPGDYQLDMYVGDGTWDVREYAGAIGFTVGSPRTTVELTLPPRRLTTLEVHPR